tara:strand:- start:86 stop:1534 length:1449 start_codon:yes stop_codon:yes gene_type:complete
MSSVRPASGLTYNCITIGKGALTTTPEERPLILMNSTTSPTFRDCRFQLRNVNTSGGSNPVIELFQNTIAGYKGAFIYQGDGEGSLYLESTFKTIFRNYGNSVAEFNSNNALKFLQSTSNITGSTTSTHPHNTTNRMNNIYCNEVVCGSPISQNNSISYKAFQSKYSLATIQGLGTDVPGPNRIAMLELGSSQVIGSANNAVYPIMRVNAPVADAEWYMYVQANTDGDEYNGFAFSDSTTPDYFLEFDSGGSVNVYQQLRAEAGLFTTGSKTFRIKHPIKAEADKDKVLYHNCVEAPRCDNLYSGKIQLVNGKAQVNLDNNEWYKMTSGTFNKLNKDLRVYVNNNDFDNWDLVKGKIEGNKLIIISNNPKSNVVVDWMVIGTRKDQEIIESHITDDFGNLIIEHVEVENDNFKMKKRNANFNRKEKQKYNKFHSLYKSFSNRLNTKTKADNGLHTARQLIKNNPNKKKVEKTEQPFIANSQN